MNIILRLHILKDGMEHYQFILLCDRTSFVNDVKQKIQSTYKSLYPEKGDIAVINIKDEENYDIPNEYCIGDIFHGNSKVLVECSSRDVSNAFTALPKESAGPSLENEDTQVSIDTTEIGKTTLPQQLTESSQPSLKRPRSSSSEQPSQKKVNTVSDDGIESSGFVYRPTNARDSISSVTSVNNRDDSLHVDDEHQNNVNQPNLVSASTEDVSPKRKELPIGKTTPSKDDKREGNEETKVLTESPKKLSPRQPTPSPTKNKKRDDMSQPSAANTRITRSSKRLEQQKGRNEAPIENTNDQTTERKQEQEESSTTSESEEEDVEEPSVLAPEIVVHETPSHPSTAAPSEEEDSSSDSDDISGSSSVSVSSSSSNDLSEESDAAEEKSTSPKESASISISKQASPRKEVPQKSDANTTTSTSNANIQDSGKKFRQISQNSDSDSESTTDSSSESESDSSIPLSQRTHPLVPEPKDERAEHPSKQSPSKATRSKANPQRPEPQRSLSYSRLSELSKTFSPEIKDPNLKKDENQKSGKGDDSKLLSKQKEQQSSSSGSEGESEENDSDEESSSSESDAPMQEKENPIPLEKRASAAVPQKKRGRGRPRKSTGLAGLAALA